MVKNGADSTTSMINAGKAYIDGIPNPPTKTTEEKPAKLIKWYNCQEQNCSYTSKQGSRVKRRTQS